MQINWVEVGPGKLALNHRPKIKDIAKLPDLGCQRIVTILSKEESAPQLGRLTEEAGMAWTWIRVGNGKFPEGEVDHVLRRALPELNQHIEQGESILIHCSAGIHRTGMFTFALLRWRGASGAEALDFILRMRRETREGLRPDHLAWGNQVALEHGR